MRYLRIVWLVVLTVLVLPSLAVAASVVTTPLPPSGQFWVLLIGALVPLATYVINHFAPWASEPVKAAVLVVASAISSALYTALAQPGGLQWNWQTVELVISGVVAALIAHKILWVPSGISTLLGGGSNAVPAPKPAVKGVSRP